MATTETQSVHNELIRIIQQQKAKEEQQDIWKDSPYKDLVKLQSNNVGNVGEALIDSICKIAKIPSNCDGSKTKKVGGGEGDGNIKGMTVEIKTAHQGSKGSSFQHELGELPWKAKYMIFIDISPTCIYITIFKNFSESTYRSKAKLPSIFPTKKATWRKGTGAFKLDTTVNINSESVKNGHAIKIEPTTPNQIEVVAAFIKSKIV